MKRLGGWGLAVAAVGLCLSVAAPAKADMKIMSKAKKAGFEAKNCLYCHNEKLPKKDKVTFNDRGQFLVNTKKEKKATEIDVNWLKDFKEKTDKK